LKRRKGFPNAVAEGGSPETRSPKKRLLEASVKGEAEGKWGRSYRPFFPLRALEFCQIPQFRNEEGK